MTDAANATKLAQCSIVCLIFVVLYELCRTLYRTRGELRSYLRYTTMLAIVLAYCITAAHVQLTGIDIDHQAFRTFAITVLGALLISIFCLRRIFGLFVSIPGPVIARYTSLWKMYHLVKETYDERVLDLHRKYGELVRVGPHEYSVSSRHLFYFSLSHLPILHPDSCFGTMGLIIRLVEGVYRLPGSSHAVVQHAWDHEDNLDECVEILLAALLAYSHQKKPVPLSKLLACYGWDMMGIMTIGEHFGFMNMKPDLTDVVYRVKTWKLCEVLSGTFFRFHPWLKFFIRLSTFQYSMEIDSFVSFSQILDQHVGPLLAEAASLLDESSSEWSSQAVWDVVKERSNFLSRLGNIPGSRMSLVRAILVLLIGGDPLATQVLAAITYLGNNGEVVKKLRDELASLIEPLSSPPTLAELIDRRDEVPYLWAVILECQRMKPMDGHSTTRLARLGNGPFGVDECRIPIDATVCFHEYSVMREKSVFGEDADVFRPERFLDPTETHILQHHGMIAPMTPDRDTRDAILAKVVVQIVRGFDVKPTSSTGCAASRFDDEAYFVVIQTLSAQLEDADIHPRSSFAEHARHIRTHLGPGFLNRLISLDKYTGQYQENEYRDLIGHKTAPIPDSTARKALHDAFRVLSKGVFDSKTNPEDHSISIVPKGCSGFQFRDRGNYHNRYNQRDRGRGGQVRPRGGDRGGRGGARGAGHNAGRRGLDAVYKKFRGPPFNANHALGNAPVKQQDLTPPSQFKRTARDLAGSLPPQKIAVMLSGQPTLSKPTTVFEKTSLVNSARTNVEVTKDGERVPGSAPVKQQDLTPPPQTQHTARAGYNPPHRRANTPTDQPTAFKPITIFKKTGLVNGVRATLEVTKDGQRVPGTTSVKQQDSIAESKPQRTSRDLASFIPPHRRVAAALAAGTVRTAEGKENKDAGGVKAKSNQGLSLPGLGAKNCAEKQDPVLSL